MADFLQPSIFTNYALNRISKDIAGQTYTTGSPVTGLLYKIGSGVTLNKFNPSASDFSGLSTVLNAKDSTGAYVDTNITITRSGSVYTIGITIDPNYSGINFNQIGIFDARGAVMAFIDLGAFIVVNQFIINNQYKMFITIDVNSGDIKFYKKEVNVNNLLGTTNILYTFISVKLGQGNNDLDPAKTEVSFHLYTIPIDIIEKGEDLVTIYATIPEDLEDITITEIAVFENFQQGSRMFTYAKVNTVKPSDLGFKLAIQLNLEMKTMRFEGTPELVINEYEYATREELNNLTQTFLDMETNLERIIANNAQEIGYNLPQVYFSKEKNIREILYSVSYATKYNQLLKKFGSNIKDLFFLTRQDYDLYYIYNMADSNSLLSITGNKFLTTSDNINFNNGAFSICTTALMGDLSTNGIILTKDNGAGSSYFTWSLEYDGSNTRLFRFILNSSPDVIGFTYNLNTSTYKSYMQANYLTYAICFNGSLASPEFTFYINGELQTITAVGSSTTSLADLSAYPTSNYRRMEGSEQLIDKIITTRISSYSKCLSAEEVYFMDLNTSQTSVTST